MKKTINKILFILTTAASISLSPPLVSAADTDIVSTKTESRTERDSSGNFVSKTTIENEDSSGTVTSDTREVKAKTDLDGSYKKTIKSKAVRDPKGLLNKSAIKSSETIESENGKYKDKSSTETKSSFTGVKTTSEGSVEVKTDAAGGFERTIETKVSSDPKGLMNKSSVKTTDKIQKKNGKGKYHYTKKVNGKTVEDKTLESK